MLFLDELPVFKIGVLEVIRQPLEDREVTITRARLRYPDPFHGTKEDKHYQIWTGQQGDALLGECL